MMSDFPICVRKRAVACIVVDCSETCVEETKSFITSVVVGKDVVPRYVYVYKSFLHVSHAMLL